MKARFTDEQIIAMVADTSLSGQRVKDWRRVATRCVVLPRFSSGLFRAMFAMKEIRNGKEIHRRVSA